MEQEVWNEGLGNAEPEQWRPQPETAVSQRVDVQPRAQNGEPEFLFVSGGTDEEGEDEKTCNGDGERNCATVAAPGGCGGNGFTGGTEQRPSILLGTS